MRILFYRYGSICEPDIMECFIESGHEVGEITIEVTNKNTTFSESVAAVSKALDDKQYDCVFTINFFPAISDLCNIYRIRYIAWTVDSPVLELFAESVSNPYNRLFVFDRQQYEDIHKYNPDCIFHFPLAVNVNSKRQVTDNSSETLRRKFASDISFVGSLYSEKNPMDNLINPPEYLKGYLEGVCEAQLKIYGCYFVKEALTKEVVRDFKAAMGSSFYKYELETYLTDEDTISQYYIGNKITAMERERMMKIISEKFSLDLYTGSDLSGLPKVNAKGFAKSQTEMPVIFHESKINLNPTSKAIRSGIPQRAFDIMACEGFMLSNYQSELCELFTPGEDFACYDSLESLPEIIDYYLNHESIRKEMAHSAYEKVKNQYSYMVRLNKLLLTAFSS